MRSGLLAALVVALTIGGQALAADTAPPPRAPAAPAAPPAPAIKSFAGIYFGAVAGYGFGVSRISNTSGATTGDFDVNGWLLGGTLGVNFQNGTLVYGIEGDFSGTSISGDGPTGGTPITERARTLLTVRGRVGMVRNSALLYLTGGWATVKFDYTEAPNSFVATANGFAAGGGAELAVAPRITVKGEYLFVGLSRSTFLSPSPGTPTFTDFWRTNIVRAGINVRL